MNTQPTVRIATHTGVNDFPFGAPSSHLMSLLGPPDNALENYTGEVEMLYGDAFYRFYEDTFVECTFPDTYLFVIDGIPVLSMFEWLKGQGDAVDRARFRISLQQGIAYDFRHRERGSITIFEQGRWDTLLA